MRYHSTRGEAPELGFDEVLLAGLASDGGLYLPTTWPSLDVAALAGKTYQDVAGAVLRPFVGPAIDEGDLDRLIADAYADFGHQAVTPLVQINERLWLLELFHGATLAFKDVALQLLGRLFDHVLARRGRHITVIGATSGDTGSAAIEAFRDRANVDVVILYPAGRTSEVQRRQMTTVDSPSVHAVAVDGTFDDCQALVKAMFADPGLRADLGLAAVNSINWARIAAQTVYYVTSAVALGAPARKVAFTVPTGNFGNVYAGWVASRMGVPIGHLHVATNANDILARYLSHAEMSTDTVVRTLSPSMDIQVSSNFERLLADVHGRDGAEVARVMARLKQGGRFTTDAGPFQQIRAMFAGTRADDEITLATMRSVHAETGMLVDPHTAVGLHAASAAMAELPAEMPMISLACAHPAKFPDAVEQATGIRPPLPGRLADLYDRPEHTTTLTNDLGAVSAFVRGVSRAAGSAKRAQ